jgi:hypothetical protein
MVRTRPRPDEPKIAADRANRPPQQKGGTKPISSVEVCSIAQQSRWLEEHNKQNEDRKREHTAKGNVR